jgi:hypothetical protein
MTVAMSPVDSTPMSSPWMPILEVSDVALFQDILQPSMQQVRKFDGRFYLLIIVRDRWVLNGPSPKLT